MMLAGPIVFEVLFVALILWATRAGNRKLEWFAKPAASAVFLWVGLMRWGHGSTFDSLMVLGLSLGMAGDLLLIENRTFRLGLLTFLAGHCATISAFAFASSWTSWPRWMLIPIGAACLASSRWLWPHTGRLRSPVTAYVVVISVLMWGGLAVTSAAVLPLTAPTGAVLFAVSDLMVARHRFIKKQFLNRAIGLPLYYAAQLMFAWTVGTL